MQSMPEPTPGLTVELCYAKPGLQFLRTLSVPPGTTLQQAIRLSGVLDAAPEIDLTTCQAGIHGKHRPLATEVREGDRIEIYRPLIIDPKDARRRRAAGKT
jgi:putative ubiquitin-RnfH superfamily antitoxin RatB of RatAB toxin-antitoxin module